MIEKKPGKIGAFLNKLATNKALNEKRLLSGDKKKLIEARTQTLKALVEQEKVKSELKELQKKNSVNYDTIFKSSGMFT